MCFFIIIIIIIIILGPVVCISSFKEEKEVCSFSFFLLLTHFSPVFHFYTPWKRQKTKGFLTFSNVIKMVHRPKIG